MKAERKSVLVVGAGDATGGAIARRFARVVIDGAIDTAFIRERFPERYALKDRGGILDPGAIAEAYWQLHGQSRSAWTHELDLRPWIEPW